jgi:hypothetical protein
MVGDDSASAESQYGLVAQPHRDVGFFFVRFGVNLPDDLLGTVADPGDREYLALHG